MTDNSFQTAGCTDFLNTQAALSRRGFFKGVMALGGGVVLSTQGLDLAFADNFDETGGSTPAGDIMVNLNMRGGMDGLLAVPVLGAAGIGAARPTLALADSELLPLDGFFGLHPKLAGFKQLFDAKELSIAHAVGTPFGTRSHFDDQLAIELSAYYSNTTVDGWQSRLLKSTGATAVFSGIGVSQNNPVSLKDAPGGVAFDAFSDVLLKDFKMERGAQLELLQILHNDSGRYWSAVAQTSLAATAQLEKVAQTAAGTYPDTEVASRFKLLAQLIKAGLPIRTANVDFDGDLDVHVAAGNRTGAMADNFQRLNDAIMAFRADLGPLWQRTTVTTITEFGRRFEENAAAGLDHGWASVMFVMGGSVSGGKVHARWPGIGAGDLVNGDLKVTTDYRSVLAHVMQQRAGISSTQLTQIFPNFKPEEISLV